MLSAVARIWQRRERTELEAADVFARHALELHALGAGPKITALAARAAQDEQEHAALCRGIVEACEPGLPALPPALGSALGPPALPRARRALYTSVALGCVTETLSTALLCAMQERARDPRVRATVHRVLRDEVLHSRLGWAHLAAAARRDDVTWLARHVPDMLRAALAGEASGLAPDADLSAYGILSPRDAQRIVADVERDVLRPGFARYGITWA